MISVDLTAGQADLYIGQELIASLTKEDSDAAGLSLESYSDLASRQAKGAIDAYRKDRSGSAIAQGFGRSGVAVLLTLLACWIVRWILNFATFRFYKIPRKAPLHIIVRGSKVVSRKQFKRLAQKFALLLKRVFYLAFVFVGFSYVLRQFPWTQEYGDRLFGILKAEVTKFGKSTTSSIWVCPMGIGRLPGRIVRWEFGRLERTAGSKFLSIKRWRDWGIGVDLPGALALFIGAA